MKILTKITCFTLMILGFSNCFSTQKFLPDKTVIMNQNSQLIYEVRKTSRGEKIFIKQNGKIVSSLDQSSVTVITDSLFNIASKVCHLKIRPDSVTVSLGVIAATWDTERLCK